MERQYQPTNSAPDSADLPQATRVTRCDVLPVKRHEDAPRYRPVTSGRADEAVSWSAATTGISSPHPAAAETHHEDDDPGADDRMRSGVHARCGIASIGCTRADRPAGESRSLL